MKELMVRRTRLQIKKYYKEDLENVELSVSDSLKDFLEISLEKIDLLEKDDSVKIELKFLESDEAGNIEGNVKVDGGGQSDYVNINLNYIKDYVPTEEEEKEIIVKTKTCSEMEGKKCGDDETCEGDSDFAKDGKCCLGECKGSGGSGISGKILGWGLLVVVVIFLIWFFRSRYRRGY